jgi:hypothetical protein
MTAETITAQPAPAPAPAEDVIDQAAAEARYRWEPYQTDCGTPADLDPADWSSLSVL